MLTILSRPRAHFRCHRLHGKHWHLVSRLRTGWAAARTAHIPRWQWGRPTCRDYQGEFLYLECAPCYQWRGFVCQYINLVSNCGCTHLLFCIYIFMASWNTPQTTHLFLCYQNTAHIPPTSVFRFLEPRQGSKSERWTQTTQNSSSLRSKPIHGPRLVNAVQPVIKKKNRQHAQCTTPISTYLKWQQTTFPPNIMGWA